MTIDSWWIDEPKILGSNNPTTAELEQLRSQGFSVIVSLLLPGEHEPAYDLEQARKSGFACQSIPVKDVTAPSLEQLKEFLEIVGSLGADDKLLVHCQAGIGRTGTFAAAYWISRGLSVREAVAKIRKLRWGAIETSLQEAVLGEFAARLEQQSKPSKQP